MKKEVTIPSVGESITSGVIVGWLKQNGDAVKEGENLFELETDKAVLEVPSPADGVLEILVGESTEVQIGQTVALLDEAQASRAETPKAEKQQTQETQPQATAPAPEKPLAAPPSPPAEKEAEKPASAPTARVTTAPSPTPPTQAPSGRRTERVAMTAIRKRTAERLVKARQTAAYLTTFNEIDMEKVTGIRAHYRAAFEAEHGIKIGFMSFFVKACCQALKEYPGVNAMVDGDEIVYNHFYDIGVAISTEHGLIVPIVRNADTLNFAQIEAAIADLARRAKDKRLAPDELTGGTFTITNGGVFGSLLSTPIPAYPQSAILGMHTIKKRPVIVDDAVVIRPMMYVALSYDHRVIDGREAIGCLARIKEYIEDPDKLLLEL